jgi:hypothetical protein
MAPTVHENENLQKLREACHTRNLDLFVSICAGASSPFDLQYRILAGLFRSGQYIMALKLLISREKNKTDKDSVCCVDDKYFREHKEIFIKVHLTNKSDLFDDENPYSLAMNLFALAMIIRRYYPNLRNCTVRRSIDRFVVLRLAKENRYDLITHYFDAIGQDRLCLFHSDLLHDPEILADNAILDQLFQVLRRDRYTQQRSLGVIDWDHVDRTLFPLVGYLPIELPPIYTIFRTFRLNMTMSDDLLRSVPHINYSYLEKLRGTADRQTINGIERVKEMSYNDYLIRPNFKGITRTQLPYKEGNGYDVPKEAEQSVIVAGENVLMLYGLILILMITGYFIIYWPLQYYPPHTMTVIGCGFASVIFAGVLHGKYGVMREMVNIVRIITAITCFTYLVNEKSIGSMWLPLVGSQLLIMVIDLYCSSDLSWKKLLADY